MNLTKLELFSFEDRSVHTSYDENGAVQDKTVLKEKGTVSYNMSTGELRLDASDGAGFSIAVNPLITNGLVEWIKSNIRKSEEQEAQYRQQREQEHEERMKSLEAQSEEAQLRLEEEKLRHEIRMTELQTELAARKLELKKAQAELDEQ